MGFVPGQKKVAAFMPQYAEEEACQVRVAFLAAVVAQPSAAVTVGKGAAKAKKIRSGAAMGTEWIKSGPAR
jgi:hypothetical protein